MTLNRDHAWGHFNLGFALRRVGRVQESLSEFREAKRIDPTIGEGSSPMLDTDGQLEQGTGRTLYE